MTDPKIMSYESIMMPEFTPIQGRIQIAHTCETCAHHHPGYDVTMQDDECGGCCSWNDHWEAKYE